MGQRFQELGAQRIGISADPVQKQAKFADKYALDFPLLSDPEFAIADTYGAARPGPLFNKRVTYVIAKDGSVLDVIKSELSMQVHADRALESLTSHLRNQPVP
jgi:peroxiredoxin Q/BCP